MKERPILMSAPMVRAILDGADGHFEWNAGDDPTIETCSAWKPSIHMLRSISRITLEIVSVRVERLNDISEGDASREGVYFDSSKIGYWSADKVTWWNSAREAFADLWASINGRESLALNPWVWVVEFKRIAQPDGVNNSRRHGA